MLGESEEIEGRGRKRGWGGGGSSHSTTPAVRTLVKQRGGFNESLSIDGLTIGQHLASYARVTVWGKMEHTTKVEIPLN